MLLAPKAVQMIPGWITKGGAPTGACSATSAQGALDVATHHHWGGKWYGSLSSYFLTSILGENESGKKFFWEIYVNNVAATSGACGIQLKAGDKVLFAAVSTRSKNPHPTALRGPSQVTVGTPLRIQVVYFNAAGKARPLARAGVSGTGVSVVTNSHGFASIKVSKAGTLVLRTSPSGYVRAAPLTVQEVQFY